ncbi:MAG: M23 family metallopeptidase [Jatrophihabitans sp.]
MSDLLARLSETTTEPAAAVAAPLLASDFIAQFGGTASVARSAARAKERESRIASWRAAVPALVKPAVFPIRLAISRPALAIAVVVAAGAATAATSVPAAPSTHQQVTAHSAAATGTIDSTNDSLKVGAGSGASASSEQNRVSREKRTPLKPAMKPGQTVAGTWILPAPGMITTCFCMRWGVMHNGIDIAKGYGVPIRAVGDGVVLEAGPAEGFGNWVVIRHSNGDVSIYGHMESYSVHAGEKVKAGEIIAKEGSEGYSTGPHVHFEVHRGGLNGPPIDPVPWLHARGVKLPPYDPNE